MTIPTPAQVRDAAIASLPPITTEIQARYINRGDHLVWEKDGKLRHFHVTGFVSFPANCSRSNVHVPTDRGDFCMNWQEPVGLVIG